MNLVALMASMTASDWIFQLVVPAAVAVVAAVATMFVTRSNEVVNQRREHYAEAVEALFAWMELPYRIRRRTGDDATTLSNLANRAHDLHEQIARHQAWIAADHQGIARAYEAARKTIRKHVGPAMKKAWTSKRVFRPAEMNLDGWLTYDSECHEAIAKLQLAIQSRFRFLGCCRPSANDNSQSEHVSRILDGEDGDLSERQDVSSKIHSRSSKQFYMWVVLILAFSLTALIWYRWIQLMGDVHLTGWVIITISMGVISFPAFLFVRTRDNASEIALVAIVWSAILWILNSIYEWDGLVDLIQTIGSLCGIFALFKLVTGYIGKATAPLVRRISEQEDFR